MNHYRKTMRTYKTRQRADGCPFCSSETVEKAIFRDDYMYIVPNLTSYDLWELHDVTDHLLIVPLRHTESIEGLNENEQHTLINLIAKYEKKGYSVYARGVGFVKRSVNHQHTHLIKVTNKRPRFALLISKPYYLLKK